MPVISPLRVVYIAVPAGNGTERGKVALAPDEHPKRHLAQTLPKQRPGLVPLDPIPQAGNGTESAAEIHENPRTVIRVCRQ